jgi:hypothetical protein
MPAIVLAIDKVKHKTSTSRWARYQERNPRFALYLTSVALGLVALAFAGLFLIVSTYLIGCLLILFLF